MACLENTEEQRDSATMEGDDEEEEENCIHRRSFRTLSTIRTCAGPCICSLGVKKEKSKRGEMNERLAKPSISPEISIHVIGVKILTLRANDLDRESKTELFCKPFEGSPK